MRSMEKHHRCMMITKRLCLILALSFLLLSCATVPYTGRKSLSLVSDSDMMSLSLQQYAQVLKDSKLSGNVKDVQMVKNAGQRIASASEAFMRDTGRQADIKSFQWEFNLIDEAKTVNAWCMPGGKVAVYTGLLPVTKDETGLAVVVGHEVAHAIARHGNERMSESLLVQLGGLGLSLALTQKPKATQDLFLSLYGVSSQVGFMLPYSRLHEAEADRIGLMLMARAGYDPSESIKLWERMAAQGGSRPPQLLSTHPAPEARIANLRALIPEVMPYYKGGR